MCCNCPIPSTLKFCAEGLAAESLLHDCGIPPVALDHAYHCSKGRCIVQLLVNC
jgi:hypothetical protein